MFIPNRIDHRQVNEEDGRPNKCRFDTGLKMMKIENSVKP